jgi:glycosyl transferase family 25
MKNIQVYLINLDADRDRLEFMDNQFKELGIAYERFPAIRGKDLPHWLAPYFTGSDLSRGEIGCYASHLSVMRQVELSGKPGLVFEDDERIKPEFPGLLEEILSLDLPFDILRISSIRKKRIILTQAELSGDYRIVRYLRIPMNMGAYLITPAGARRFIEWKTQRTAPIDFDMARVWEHKIRTLGVWPEPVLHNVLASSSIDTAEKRHERWKPGKVTQISDSAKRLVHALVARPLAR